MSSKPAQCGCVGKRSCLLCEEDCEIPSTTSEHQFYQCFNCGRLLEVSKTTDLPLTCSARCRPAPNLTVPDHVTVKDNIIQFGGVSVVKEFVNNEEESSLVNSIDKYGWFPSQSGRRKQVCDSTNCVFTPYVYILCVFVCVQDYGPKVNFKKRKVKLGMFTGLPDYSKHLVESMVAMPILDHFMPVEQCNLDYDTSRGSAIVAHSDDEWLWGERLVTINLLSSTFLTFSLREHSVAVHVPLPQRSLVVVSGPARHQWLHSISREHIKGRRVAITFRELGEDFLPGGEDEATGQQLIKLATTFTGLPVN